MLFTVGGKLCGRAEALTLLLLLLPPLFELMPMLDRIFEKGDDVEVEDEETPFPPTAAAAAVVGLVGAGGFGFGGGVVLLLNDCLLLPLDGGGGVTRLSRLFNFLVASLTEEEETFLDTFSVLLNFSLEPES